MRTSKTVLTTGEVAKICNVAPRTVSKWFDAGHLRGYRIPGSKDRRIPVEQLVRFMKAHGIPLNGLNGGSRSVLVVDGDAGLCDALRASLTEHGRYDVTTATCALEAGAAAHELKPQVILMDVTLPDMAPKAATRFFRSLDTVTATCMIGMSKRLSDAEGQALLQDGFDAYIEKPFETRALIQLIEDIASAAVTGDVP